MTIGTRAIGFTQTPKFPKAEGYNIKVGPTWFRTVAAPDNEIIIGTRDSLAQRVDQTALPTRAVLDIGYAWARTDLSGGEGLDWDPREIALERNEIDLDRIRFWDSANIQTERPETQGEQYKLELARVFQDSKFVVPNPIDMTVSNLNIYVAGDDQVLIFSSWTDGTPFSATGLPEGDNIIAIAAAPNDTVMTTHESGDIFVKPSTVTIFEIAYNHLQPAKPEAKGIWYLQGRFIASTFEAPDASELIELVWDGSAGDWTTIAPLTIDTADAEFWSVVESGPAIVAACNDGTVRSYTPDSSGATPTMVLIPRSRTTMPEGESPILLGSNAGVLVIMTTADHEQEDRQELRLYKAEVLDERFDFVVGQLQLKREWRAAEHEGLVTRNMTNTRDSIFFFVKEENNEQQAVDESLWRLDVVTQGLTRVAVTENVNLNGLVIFNQFIGGIDFNSNLVLVSDPDLHQIEGYVIFPNITFGLNTPITWIATIVEAFDLVDSGGQIELFFSDNPQAILDPNHPTWVLTQRLSSQGASNLEVPFANLRSRTLSLQLRIKASTALSISPKVTRIALRGIPAHRDLVMLVPFNVSDYVSAPGRRPIRIPGLGNSLHDQVLSLVGSSVEALVIDPPMGFRGIINNVSEPVELVTSRGSVTRYVTVEFRGQRLTQTVPPTGDSGMGLGLMGIAIIGIGQSEDT